MKTSQFEKEGFSSARLNRISTVMQRYVDERKIAGTVTLIARHGNIVHFNSCGMADIENKMPMQLDTIFRIYSMTKPITSVAVLMLLEEGKIRLSDPISMYIPAFKKVKVLDETSGSGVRYVTPHREITILDLLTHTAGLSYGFDEDVYLDELYRKELWALVDNNPDLTLEACVQSVAQLPLAFHPGSRYRYSFATDVLGYLVQVISGLPFDKFFQQRIFSPLHMEDTDFYVPHEKVNRFSTIYGPDAQSGLKPTDAALTSRFTRPTNNPSGGSGLVSTAEDYFRFCQMLLNKGTYNGERILSRKAIELMTQNHLPEGIYPFDDKSSGFGLGVSILLDLGKSQCLGSIGSFGWGGAANTNFWIDPQEELIGILMLQYMPSDTYPIVPDFRNLTYQSLVD